MTCGRGAGLLLAALLAGAASRSDDWQTDLDRRVLAQFTGVQESGPLVFHFRPGDLAEETLKADVAANREHFEELQQRLEMHYDGQVHVFLYRDGDDMQATTEGDANIAFSTGTRSIHQVHDFRGVHELTHIFAVQFPDNPDGAGPDLFATEGLATGMARSDQDVGVHSWAAMYLRLGRLPDLSELRGDFMGRAGPGVHPYHVAGSFVLWLTERFGVPRVKQWYVNSGEAGQVFGIPFARLERDWRDFLASHEVTPAEAAYVREKFSRKLGGPMPEAWHTAPGTSLLADDAAGLQPEDPARWTLRDGILVGQHDGPWTVTFSRRSFGPDVGLRLRFRLVSGDAVQLRLAHAGGHEGQAIFARWCSYVSEGDEGFKDNDQVKLAPGVWVEAVFTSVGGRGRLFLEGVPLLDLPDALPKQEGLVGLGVERGVVEVAELTVFEP